MNNSTATLNAIRKLFEYENRSADITTFDLLFLIYLNLFGGQTADTYETLTRRLSCSARTLRMSLERLERLGYISITAQRGGSNVVKLVDSKYHQQEKAA